MRTRSSPYSQTPQHRGTDGLRCLEEHASLDGNVQGTVEVQTLERLNKPKLLDVDLSIAMHMVFGGQVQFSNSQRQAALDSLDLKGSRSTVSCPTCNCGS